MKKLNSRIQEKNSKISLSKPKKKKSCFFIFKLKNFLFHDTNFKSYTNRVTRELNDEVIPQLESDYKKSFEEFNEISGKEKKLSESVNKNRLKCAEAQSSFSTNRNRNRVLSFLMQLKNEGKLSGLYGRLVLNKSVLNCIGQDRTNYYLNWNIT